MPDRMNHFSSLELVMLNFPNLSTLGPEFARKCQLWQHLSRHCSSSPGQTKKDINAQIAPFKSPKHVENCHIFLLRISLQLAMIEPFKVGGWISHLPHVSPTSPPTPCRSTDMLCVSRPDKISTKDLYDQIPIRIPDSGICYITLYLV